MSSSEGDKQTETGVHNPPRRRKRSKSDPPLMRIVLLGKSTSENSRVGNFILGRSAFDSESPSDVVERVGGKLKDRIVTLINSPQFLQTHLSFPQLTQTLRECVRLSAPGPHVIVLLLNNQCSAADGERLQQLKDSLSERMFQHSLLLSTGELTETSETLQQILQRFTLRHASLKTSGSPEELLQIFEEIERSNEGRHLLCDYERSQEITMKQQDIGRLLEGVKLNLVVCGSDSTLKSSISERIQQQADADLHLLELPALFNTGLSEQEVMRQMLHYVSLCRPGVHVFLLVIPDAPLTDEDKAEMEEIQRIFSSRINRHTMILIKQSSERQTAELNEEMQVVIQSFGGRHHSFGPVTSLDTPVTSLMEKIEQMMEENRGDFYSTETFLETLMEKLLIFTKIKKKITSLERQLLSPALTESEDDLRIVLLGKTGVGKSASGNTILGRDVFTAELYQESVTKESQRESSEANGRRVTVIDTPGLFDTELSNEEIRREISHCISMMLPGPHVFIIVLNLGQRFTQEEARSVKIIQEMFGEHSIMYTMVLFTRGDYLKITKNKTIDQCLGKPGSPLMNLIEACGNRYHVFNNNETGDRTQVYELLEKIDSMVKANGGSFYSCKMFREMERDRQEQQMKILMETVEKLDREKEELLKRWEREQLISEEQIWRLKSEIGGKVKIEKETQEQLDDLEKRLEKEINMRADQLRTFEEKLKFCEEQHEDELKARRLEWRKEYEREKEEMNMICSETDALRQVRALGKLETEYGKWSWSLHRAMRETENKLHIQIENQIIYKVEETDLQKELKMTSEVVEKSMSEFFEKDSDADILIQWKTSFEIKIKELHKNIVGETKTKLNEILHQQDLKKKFDAQRKRHENAVYEKSRQLALKFKDKANNGETLKKEFDLFWEECMKKLIKDTPPIKDIDIMKDVKLLLSDVYKSAPLNHWRESRDILFLRSYSDYARLRRLSGFNSSFENAIISAKEMFSYVLCPEDEAQIRSLVSDVVQQTDSMIQSFNISQMGYNISYIQQLIDYIKGRLTEHEEEAEKYEFKKQFFMDFSYSICNRAIKMITDQQRLFRETNDPVNYIQKKKDEYYSIFQKHCDGATSAVIFGEIICQKLKEHIEQSLLKRTARDLTDEMRTNCESLNGNRSKLEKHILKKLAEEEDFDKYMNYVHYPRDHFKSFIRDEVSRYITDQFSVSVLPKMNENTELLQQKILTAARESTEHVRVNSGDVGLWVKSFSQRLSEELIFSEKHLSGVKLKDVKDFKLLEDVIRQELTSIMSDISWSFSRNTFQVKLDYKYRPDELLIDLFCRCCWAQCLFCKAICTNTTEKHHGDHSTPFHRVTGINGTYFTFTQNLCADVCTNLVAGDLNFSSPDARFIWKKIQIEGPRSNIWRFTPDLEMPYWNWFVCRFQKDLEKYYDKTFDGSDNILDEWRTYSKQEATESLDQYI